MDLGLNNKIAIVTAASQGLGKASAISLANEGVKLIICSRDKSKINKAEKDIKELTGADVISFETDLNSSKDIDFMIKKVMEKHGRVDILVNNTGGPKAGFFDDLSDLIKKLDECIIFAKSRSKINKIKLKIYG